MKTIEETVDELVSDRPEVGKVVLFGSVAEGRALPSSDIDILLITDQSNERFIDRPSHYIHYFGPIPMSVDCFVYTCEEIESKKYPIAQTAIERGRVLFERGD